MKDATQRATAHLVPLFLNLLQLGQHSGHAVLIEVTVLQQRSVFEPQILHLLQVLWARQVGLTQDPRNPGKSAHLSGEMGISSDIVFVLLGFNCLTHKLGLIIATVSSMPWSPWETSHTPLLFSASFPALSWALRCALCTPTCLLETPSTGVGALGVEDLFLFYF